MLPSRWAGSMPFSGSAPAPYFSDELRSHVGVQRHVERPHLCPQPVDLGSECVGRHVVIRTPQRSGICEAELARALVRQLDEPGIAIAHGCSDGVPPLPDIGELLRIAARREDVGRGVDIEARAAVVAGSICLCRSPLRARMTRRDNSSRSPLLSGAGAESMSFSSLSLRASASGRLSCSKRRAPRASSLTAAASSLCASAAIFWVSTVMKLF